MEQRTAVLNSNVANIQDVSQSIYFDYTQPESTGKTKVYEYLVSEGCESFYNYIDWLGLAKKPKLTVLSSSRFYYYDTEDLMDIETLVNQKKLNQINKIKPFLHNIFHILPAKSYFVGCFIDKSNKGGSFFDMFKARDLSETYSDQVEDGIISRIPFIDKMYNLVDSRTNRSLTKRTVSLMLEDAGMKVLDMSELEGITYFCCQKSNNH